VTDGVGDGVRLTEIDDDGEVVGLDVGDVVAEAVGVTDLEGVTLDVGEFVGEFEGVVLGVTDMVGETEAQTTVKAMVMSTTPSATSVPLTAAMTSLLMPLIAVVQQGMRREWLCQCADEVHS
jgi:hypothetical protein